MNGVVVTCPGCGVAVARAPGDPEAAENVSGPCRRLIGELYAYTQTCDPSIFIHQHAVDAYAAQHVGPHSKPITGAFALVGLHLAVERGFNGRQVQRVHMLLANRQKEWPRFQRPATRASLTVAEVLDAAAGNARDQMLMRWCAAVWETWSDDHTRVRALMQVLDGSRAGGGGTRR